MLIIKVLIGLYMTLWAVRFYVLITGTNVIRISFTGLENMFHAPYEYYVSNGYLKAKVPKALVTWRFQDYSDDLSIYNHDENRTIWYFVQIQYSPVSKPLFKTDCMIPLNEDGTYLLTYEKWNASHAESHIPVSSELEAQFLSVAHAKYDTQKAVDPDEANWYGGGNIGVMSFMLIPNGEQSMVELDQEELYTLKNGKLHKIMNIPKRGNLDYIYMAE